MTNVLISFWAPIFEENPYGLVCFYESLAKVLIENGNNVLTMNLSHFKEYDTSEIKNYQVNEDVSNQINKFSPDLIISFNHQLLSSWRSDYDCPIVVWDADSLEMFSNIKDFKENSYRYSIFTSCDSWVNKYEKIGIFNDKIFYIPPATYLKPKNIKQDKNISIIASRFGMPLKTKEILQDGKYNHLLYDIFLDSLKNPSYNFQEKLTETGHFELQDLNKNDLWQFFDNRNIILTSLLDLGLNIYGVNWEDIAEYNPQLLLAYDKENKYSVKHNEEVYNSSKICININHPQTEGKCFSWRVMDIMGTNGCLVSSYSNELHNLTKDYVDIPMFHNHLEARKICKELLSNEDLRKEIVKGSNEYVKENANLEDRLDYMSEAIGLNLLNGKVKLGSLEVVKLGDIKRKNTDKIKKKENFRTKIKNKILSQSNQYNFYKKNYISTKIKNKKLNSVLRNKDSIIKEKNNKLNSVLRNKDSIIKENNNKINLLKDQISTLKNEESKLLKNNIQLLDNEINWKKDEEKLQNKLLDIEKYLSLDIEEDIERNLTLLKYKFQAGKKIKVVFLTYYNLWETNERLYRLLDKDPIFDVEIVVVPYKYSLDELKRKEYDEFYDYLKINHNVVKGYKFENESSIDIKSLKIDILFYPSPYMSVFPENFQISKIPRSILSCYIPYGIYIAKIQEYQFNTELHNKAWKIFAETPFHKYLACKYSGYGSNNVVVSGYPNMDPLFDQSYLNEKNIWKNKNTKKIIWAPHWTFKGDEVNFSTFDKNYKFFYEFAKENPNIELVFKPHPLLRKSLIEENILPKKEVEEYFDKFANLPNCSYCEGSEYMKLFVSSDAMITDGVSYLGEYLYCNKPGLHLTKDTQCFNEFGEKVVKNWYNCNGEDFECIISFINDVVIDNNDFLKDKRQAFYDKYLNINNEELASQKIYDFLKKSIESIE